LPDEQHRIFPPGQNSSTQPTNFVVASWRCTVFAGPPRRRLPDAVRLRVRLLPRGRGVDVLQGPAANRRGLLAVLPPPALLRPRPAVLRRGPRPRVRPGRWAGLGAARPDR